jgi:hypothetical protein
MAMAKAVPEMSSGRIFTEWKFLRPANLSHAAVIETKNAEFAIGGGSTAENDAIGSDIGRANLRLGPNIPSEAAESLLDINMPECWSNYALRKTGHGPLDREWLSLRKFSVHRTPLCG